MYGGERIGVTRNGKLAAVVVGVADPEALEALEMAQDVAAYRAATATAAAARQLRTLDQPVRARLIAAVEGLADDPRPAGATTLVGEETAWRIRVGDHRVIYDVLDQALIVTVVRPGHRREA